MKRLLVKHANLQDMLDQADFEQLQGAAEGTGIAAVFDDPWDACREGCDDEYIDDYCEAISDDGSSGWDFYAEEYADEFGIDLYSTYVAMFSGKEIINAEDFDEFKTSFYNALTAAEKKKLEKALETYLG